MKEQIKYLALIIICIIGITSCEDFEVEDPKADFKILKAVSPTAYEEASTFEVGEDVFIENLGTGEMFTVYTGDEGHDGLSKTFVDSEGDEKMNTGFFMNHPREETYFKYNYGESGTFTIKVIAITTDEEGTNISQDMVTREVTIVEAP